MRKMSSCDVAVETPETQVNLMSLRPWWVLDHAMTSSMRWRIRASLLSGVSRDRGAPHGPRDAPPVGRRRFQPSLERPAVAGDETERLRVPEGPLEVVEQRPVEDATYVQPVGEARRDPLGDRVDELDALRVVVGRDPRLDDDDREPRHRRSPPDRVLHGLGSVLVPHLGAADVVA